MKPATILGLLTFGLVLVLSLPTFAEDDASVSRQIELMNRATKSELQLEYSRFVSRIESRLAEIERQNDLIAARLDHRDADVGNYIDAISWVSGIVIGFVGILFGIGAFILYRENKDVTTRAMAQLDAWDKEAENLQSKFDQWFRDAKGVYAGELEQLGRIMRLRVILDQEKPSADEIYPDLSPLFADPHLAYLPIFSKVMTLDIDEDIKRHTQAAIDQLRTKSSK